MPTRNTTAWNWYGKENQNPQNLLMMPIGTYPPKTLEDTALRDVNSPYGQFILFCKYQQKIKTHE